MPAWIISAIVQIAIKVGVPWILLKFPKLPEECGQILQELVDAINGHKADCKDNVRSAKDTAIQKMKESLSNTAQAPEIKQ